MLSAIKMKEIKQIALAIGLILSIPSLTCAKAILIPVKDVFKSLTNIEKIKIIGYAGDSIMTYINLRNRDTLNLDCNWKKYSESSFKIMKKNDPNYSSWEGTFPEIGESIIMLSYEHGGSRILFARKKNEEYRFWDPKSIPFANSVFFMTKGSGYKPTYFCKEQYQTETEFHCSDGFLIEEKEFEKIKNNFRAYASKFPWNVKATVIANQAIVQSIFNMNNLSEQSRPSNLPNSPGPFNVPFTQKEIVDFKVVGYSSTENTTDIYDIEFRPENSLHSGNRFTVKINMKTFEVIMVYMQADA